MTAELSQIFRTKRDGVAFVVEAATRAFPDCLVRVYAVDGRWLTADEARREPLAIAAANWAAAARLVARSFPDCILIDVGSTTTDIIPIAGGVPAALGRTDPERLCEGELVYTRSEEHTSELQSLAYLVCRLLLEKKKKKRKQ